MANLPLGQLLHSKPYPRWRKRTVTVPGIHLPAGDPPFPHLSCEHPGARTQEPL